MELKVGDKVKLLNDVPWAEVHAYYLKGSELIITEKLEDGSYFAKNGYGRIARIYNKDFELVENTNKINNELKVGDKLALKFYLTKEEKDLDYILKSYNEYFIEKYLGKTYTVEYISKRGNYKCKNIVPWINPQWIDWEETNKLNKLKMVIGENRVVEIGDYRIVWEYDDDYTKCDNCSQINLEKDGFTEYTVAFTKDNYHQQLEITNLILDKLGLNVELVEEDVNKEVLEQIEKLETELEKLRGMIK